MEVLTKEDVFEQRPKMRSRGDTYMDFWGEETSRWRQWKSLIWPREAAPGTQANSERKSGLLGQKRTWALILNETDQILLTLE